MHVCIPYVEGHYSDYIVESLSEHDTTSRFKYSRYTRVCGRAQREFAWGWTILL